MIASDYRGARALDRYWDKLVREASATPDSDLAGTVRHLHADDPVPRPDTTFIARLREDLMLRAFERRAALPAPPVSPSNGRAAPDRSARAVPANAPKRQTWRWLTQDAVAVALVALIVLGIFAGSGNIAGLLDFRQDVPGETAMFQGDAGRSGTMPGPLPAGQPGLLWRLGAGIVPVSPVSSPVVADGVVYFAGALRQPGSTIAPPALFAIDLATGEIRWQEEMSGLGEMGTPAVSGGTLYVGISEVDVTATPVAGQSTDPGSDPGYLIALDAATGAERWRASIGSAGYQSPAVLDGVVYIGSAGGRVHAIDAGSGDERWVFSAPNPGETLTSASVAAADGLVFFATNRGLLYALDATNGQERWHNTVGGESPTTPVVAEGVVYVGADQATDTIEPDAVSGMGAFLNPPYPSSGDFLLYAFDTADGSQRWSADLGTAVKGVEPSPAVIGGTLVIAGVGAGWREVRALDSADGSERWRFVADQTINAAPTVADGTVIADSFGGRVYALALDTGHPVWSVETGGPIVTSAYLADGAVVVGSGDGNLYAIGGTAPAAGTPVATPVEDGDLSGLADCDVTPRPTVVPERPLPASASPVADETVTPVASLVPVSKAQRYGDVPGITWEQVPTGPPASDEAMAGITETIGQMVACARPGRDAQLAALYSDDFQRRPWVMAYTRYNGYWSWAPSPAFGAEMTIKQTIALPDGRVAVVFSYQGGDAVYGWLAVFAEQNGRWLVDELIEISPFGDSLG